MPYRYGRERKGEAARVQRNKGIYKARRTGKGVRRTLRALWNQGPRVYNFKRCSLLPGINVNANITNGTTPSGLRTWSVAPNTQGNFCVVPSLADTVNNIELSALFDQYKINCVVYEIAYQNNFSDNTLANSQLPYMVTVQDFDDSATAPEGDLLQYNTARKFYFGNNAKRVARIKVRPRINLIGNDGLANYGVQFPGYFKGWLDCAAPAVQHFALKGAIVNDAPAAVAQTFTVSAKYYLSFKTTR